MARYGDRNRSVMENGGPDAQPVGGIWGADTVAAESPSGVAGASMRRQRLG